MESAQPGPGPKEVLGVGWGEPRRAERKSPPSQGQTPEPSRAGSGRWPGLAHMQALTWAYPPGPLPGRWAGRGGLGGAWRTPSALPHPQRICLAKGTEPGP